MPSLKPSVPDKIVIIGASTGGPHQIKQIVRNLPHEYRAALLIAQHMSQEFIATFASGLQHDTSLPVKMARHNERVAPSTLYLASQHCTLIEADNALWFHIRPHAAEAFNPDIDALMLSCAELTRPVKLLAVILSGIGSDGALGVKALDAKGAVCIAENEQSSAVYGMPLRAKEASLNVKVESLDEIIRSIIAFGV